MPDTAMNVLLYIAGSTRTMLGCFAVLSVALLFAGEDNAWAVPLALTALALNLAAAIAVHPRLRRGGLGVFHACLLALLVTAAVGQLTRFDGHVEVVEGGAFEPQAVTTVRAGPLHAWRLPRDAFVQGPWTVDYAPGVKRAHTRSAVLVAQADGSAQPQVVGDDEPLRIDGYRLYTTHNKGFAPVVTWLPDAGEPATGALHMPSYPLFDWKQEARWEVPGQGEVRLFLQLDAPLDERVAWTLDTASIRAALVVHAEGRRTVLRPGEAVALAGGRLSYDRLTGWMGYRIFHDPTLPWLFALAAVAVAGLGAHVWRRAATVLPLHAVVAFSGGASR
jgi:cytochrome c biogenesis protein